VAAQTDRQTFTNDFNNSAEAVPFLPGFLDRLLHFFGYSFVRTEHFRFKDHALQLVQRDFMGALSDADVADPNYLRDDFSACGSEQLFANGTDCDSGCGFARACPFEDIANIALPKLQRTGQISMSGAESGYGFAPYLFIHFRVFKVDFAYR